MNAVEYDQLTQKLAELARTVIDMRDSGMELEKLTTEIKKAFLASKGEVPDWEGGLLDTLVVALLLLADLSKVVLPDMKD